MKKQRLGHWILLGDMVWAFIALPLAYLMRYGFTWYGPTDGTFLTFVPSLLVAILLWVCLFSWMKLDGFRFGWDISATLSQLFLGLSLLMAVLFAGAYLLRIFLSRLTLCYFGGLLFVGFFTLRYLIHALLGSRYLAKAFRRVLIVGHGPVARELAAKIERHPEMLCQVVGFLCSSDTSFENPGSTPSGEAKIVQTLGIIDLLHAQRVDEVILALPNQVTPELLNLATRLRDEGIGVSVIPHPYELYISRPQLLEIGGLPVLQLREAQSRYVNSGLKRAMDIAIGSVMLVMLMPLILIGALILMMKRGHPIVRDPRCGQFGRLFRMYRLNLDRNNTQISMAESLLLRLSITEVPQFWNVIRGDMSLIGPRPESPERVKHYSDWQRQRLRIKPGMSGLAQVYGLREEHSSEEKARFDLQYMMHASPFFDISLLLQTGWTLIARLFQRDHVGSAAVEHIATEDKDVLLERALSSAHSAQSSAD